MSGDIVLDDAVRSARQPHTLTCGKCSHESEVPDDPELSVYRCEECGTTTAYGAEMPRVAHVPHADARFVVAKYSHSKAEIEFALERQYAAELALDLLSVTNPLAYQLVRAVTGVISRDASRR